MSSSEVAPVNMSRDMMIFNYSLYAFGMMLRKDTDSTMQTFPFEFPNVKIGVRGAIIPS